MVIIKDIVTCSQICSLPSSQKVILSFSEKRDGISLKWHHQNYYGYYWCSQLVYQKMYHKLSIQKWNTKNTFTFLEIICYNSMIGAITFFHSYQFSSLLFSSILCTSNLSSLHLYLKFLLETQTLIMFLGFKLFERQSQMQRYRERASTIFHLLFNCSRI